jgi:hypothetical protein
VTTVTAFALRFHYKRSIQGTFNGHLRQIECRVQGFLLGSLSVLLLQSAADVGVQQSKGFGRHIMDGGSGDAGSNKRNIACRKMGKKLSNRREENDKFGKKRRAFSGSVWISP